MQLYSFRFVSGKALVTNVLQDSVAAENVITCNHWWLGTLLDNNTKFYWVVFVQGNVMVGDILDTLNGVVINDSLQGSLVNIMRKGAGQPVSLYVIKVCYVCLKNVPYSLNLNIYK